MGAARLPLKAHSFWRERGLEVDLVVLNDHPPSYADSLQEALSQAVESSPQRGCSSCAAASSAPHRGPVREDSC